MPTVVADPKKPNEVSFEQRARDIAAAEQEELKAIRNARKSPFDNFYQVNIDNSPILRKCLDENPKALKLLFFIFDHMDKYNALVCSYKVFQEALGMGQATVARSVKYLKENGILYIYKTGTSNVYVANKELVWRSWGTNYDYCEFPANIMLSASEQDNVKIRDKRLQTVQLKENEQ